MPAEEGALVSVVIPVYNVEKYLCQCIESVLAQTHSALDIILVDDGSTDGSGRICDDYAALDSRIRVIHQPNKGMSEARNAGLDIARGEYITFIDSDDFVGSDFVSLMLCAMANEDVDIACGGFVDYREEDRVSATPSFRSHGMTSLLLPSEKPSKVFTSEEFLEMMLYQHIGENSACGKLYKKKIFEKLRFTPGICYEDLDVIYKAVLRARRVAWRDMPLYYYRVTPGSIIHTFSLKRTDVLDVTDRMVNYLKEHCPQLEKAARSRRLSAHFNIYCLLAANGAGNREVEERCRRVIKGERGKFLFDPKVRLKNRLGILLTYLGGFPLLKSLGRRIYR